MSDVRKQFSEKYLRGRGVEFGALHNPLATPVNSQVLYVDRFTKVELLGKFPELNDHADRIVETDITLDLDNGDFSVFTGQNFQFFIANHVIEHLVNPIRFLKQIYDAMQVGAILYLSVPDKDFTFDKNRKLTSFAHLWQEYEKDTTVLSKAHLNDFILNITKDHIETERRKKMYFSGDKLPWNMFTRQKLYRLHRKRSIHVHVWDQKSFDAFLHASIEKLNLSFRVLDSTFGKKSDPSEMIYILEKTS